MNKRILLIEDNPVSREFLHEALLPLGIAVDVATCLADAMVLARQHRHSLFLCDVHLPDAGPGEIFHSLRLAQPETKIIAITAEAGHSATQDLTELGYREVWPKPIAMKALQENVARMLSSTLTPASEIIHDGLWDETAAMLAVGNNQATLKALRNMFLAELPQQAKIIREAFDANHVADLKAECHKLLAGCGFVGAHGLNDAAKRLSEKPGDQECFKHLMHQAERYLAGA